MSNCPICDSYKVRRLCNLRGIRTHQRSPVYLCMNCYSLHQRPEYYEDDKSLQNDLQWHLGKFNSHTERSETILRLLLSLNPKASTLLDIGCGIGTTILAAKQLGLVCSGVEPNPYAVKYAREKLSLDLVQGNFMAGLFPGRFDLVIADMVLEHVPEPRDFITAVFSSLNPGGYFFMAVPSLRGGAFRVIYSLIFPGTRYSIFLDNDVHINHFSRKGIMTLIAENNLIFKFEPWSGSYIIQASDSHA